MMLIGYLPKTRMIGRGDKVGRDDDPGPRIKGGGRSQKKRRGRTNTRSMINTSGRSMIGGERDDWMTV